MLEHEPQPCSDETRREQCDGCQREAAAIDPFGCRHRGSGIDADDATHVQHRRIRRRDGHANPQTDSPTPTTIEVSAMLNVVHRPTAMKSTTAPRVSRSTRLPPAPPTTRPTPTADNVDSRAPSVIVTARQAIDAHHRSVACRIDRPTNGAPENSRDPSDLTIAPLVSWSAARLPIAAPASRSVDATRPPTTRA